VGDISRGIKKLLDMLISPRKGKRVARLKENDRDGSLHNLSNHVSYEALSPS
jgi:hypothetical protein